MYYLLYLFYLDKIIEIEKTIDINVRISRFPLILKGTKQETTQLKQLIKKMYNCDGIVIGSADLTGRLESNDIHLPISIDSLYQLMLNYKNMTLASMGIYSQQVKKERLLLEEIGTNNDYVDFVYTEMREERQQWVDKINAKWGLNIKLIETYDINIEEDIEMKALETEAISNAESVGGNNE